MKTNQESEKRRVVVTGLGVIAPIGRNVDEFWNNCLKGKTAVNPIPENWHLYSKYNSLFWSTLPEVDFSSYGLIPRELSNKDMSSQLLLGAVMQAIHSGKFDFEVVNQKNNQLALSGIDVRRVGVYIGTGIGGINSLFQAHSYHIQSFIKSGIDSFVKNREDKEVELDDSLLELIEKIQKRIDIPRRYNPLTVPMIMPNASTANVGVKFGVSGPTRSYTSSCASGTVAIGNAFQEIKNNYVDMAITGGTEYFRDTTGSIYTGFDALRIMAKGEIADEVNRPFDEDRSGFLFAEGGSAVLILESLEHAEKRGAPIYGEIINYKESTDMANITAMDVSGRIIKEMMKECILSAGFSFEEIDYINSHGTGTQLNDEVEAMIIEEVFGKKVLVNSTKSLIGHAIGASGAIEALVTILSINHQTTHRCINLEKPVRDLNFVQEVKPYPIKTGLSQSFGFGGHNAMLLIKEYQPSKN